MENLVVIFPTTFPDDDSSSSQLNHDQRNSDPNRLAPLRPIQKCLLNRQIRKQQKCCVACLGVEYNACPGIAYGKPD